MIRPNDNQATVLLTGSTGLIGHYLLAELFKRNIRVAVLLRPSMLDSMKRLANLMRDLDIDLDTYVMRQQLVPIEGDVNRELLPVHHLNITSVIHGAASTRFDRDPLGEPYRTNVQGTLRLLQWMSDHRINDLHMISSAYQCGKVSAPVSETLSHIEPEVHNEYENTKWQSEMDAQSWQQRGNRTLTVYRPSVVVGHWLTGRTTKYSGFYLLPRALQILANSVAGDPSKDRHALKLRIVGRPTDCQNIVPVDYVATMIAGIYANRDLHGTTYHLTHPDPPSNGLIKSAVEQQYDIAGGEFVDPTTLNPDSLNDNERIFYDAGKAIEHYIVDTPNFLRTNAKAAEQKLGIKCPMFARPDLFRLMYFAEQSNWKTRSVSNKRRETAEASGGIASYFEQFLPEYVPQSRIANMTALTTTIRFIIEDEPNGQWACQFEKGQLVRVHRGTNSLVEDFSYRTTRDTFYRAVEGNVHPQHLLFNGDATIEGNVEQGLKMAMILHEFTREFPCKREMLQAMEVSA